MHACIAAVQLEKDTGAHTHCPIVCRCGHAAVAAVAHNGCCELVVMVLTVTNPGVGCPEPQAALVGPLSDEQVEHPVRARHDAATPRAATCAGPGLVAVRSTVECRAKIEPRARLPCPPRVAHAPATAAYAVQIAISGDATGRNTAVDVGVDCGDGTKGNEGDEESAQLQHDGEWSL